jgi:hypothetical protein
MLGVSGCRWGICGRPRIPTGLRVYSPGTDIGELDPPLSDVAVEIGDFLMPAFPTRRISGPR